MVSQQKDQGLIRTNRMLLAVAVAALVLLGPSFVAGYVYGFQTGRVRGAQAAAAQVPNPARGAKPSAAPSAKTGRRASQEPRQVYLQLVTVTKNRSAAIVDALRSGQFPVIAADVPQRPNLHRVLVGPIQPSEIDRTRAELQSKGFPGEDAIERTF